MKKYSFPIPANNVFFNYNHEDYPELHTHDYWEVMIITEGTVIHKINNLSHTLTQFALCLIRPDDSHCLVAVKNMGSSHINIGIRRDLLKTQLDLLNSCLYEELLSQNFVEYELSQRTAKYIISAIYKLQMLDKLDLQYQNQLMLLFLDIIKEIYSHYVAHKPKYSNYPKQVDILIELMQDMENISCSIDELCGKINYSHSHMIKLFKTHTNKTPIHFFHSIKMNCARNLLETTNNSILSISMQIGFSSLGHFNVSFKKFFGYPPGVYRKKWLEFYDSFPEVSDAELTN